MLEIRTRCRDSARTAWSLPERPDFLIEPLRGRLPFDER